MKLIKPSYKIRTEIDRGKILRSIEEAGKTCYKSEDEITEDSASKFVKMIMRKGHLSVIEHESISVRFICDRGVTHELVRHRLCAFSQESTRYCNYSKDKFGNQLTFILPCWFNKIKEGEYHKNDAWISSYLISSSVSEDSPEIDWLCAMIEAEEYYLLLTDFYGWTPQKARSVLPNALKTEIVTTANLREWRHILKLRTSQAAHPQIREIMIPLLEELSKTLPEVFAWWEDS